MKEVLLDSNIFIRFLIQDVPSHFEQAKEVFEGIEAGKVKGFISLLVINEVIWILENFYELKRDIYIPKLLTLLSLRNMKIMEAKKDVILTILQEMPKHNFDFTDVYLFEVKEKRSIVSFDKDFQRIMKRNVE